MVFSVSPFSFFAFDNVNCIRIEMSRLKALYCSQSVVIGLVLVYSSKLMFPILVFFRYFSAAVLHLVACSLLVFGKSLIM